MNYFSYLRRFINLHHDLFVFAVYFTLILFFMFLANYYLKNQKKFKFKHFKCVHKVAKKEAHGIIFGKVRRKLICSFEEEEGHIGVFSASGTGKTSAVGIPTLRTWQGSSFIIDISGDIEKNCPNMSRKLVFAPDEKKSMNYNIFHSVDKLKSVEDKNEALAQLALLLLPTPPNMNTNAKFFIENGQKILTAGLICYYHQRLDFIECCKKIATQGYKGLFHDIDMSNNQAAITYINCFESMSEQNIGGCKQECDNSLTLFVTNKHVINSLKRGKKSIYPQLIDNYNIFIKISEDKLDLYSQLLNIITSQLMAYISQRDVEKHKRPILLFLDEFTSLNLDSMLILHAIQRFRKRKCRIMILTQNISDINILYGKDIARSILSNLKFKVLLGGLGDPESQQYFADLIGKTDKNRYSYSESNNSNSSTKAITRDLVFETAELDRQGNDAAILICSDLSDGYLKMKKNYYFKK